MLDGRRKGGSGAYGRCGRSRLTLAHELGHMVMHRVPNASMEDQAFRIGAEFLMPDQDNRAELDGLTVN